MGTDEPDVDRGLREYHDDLVAWIAEQLDIEAGLAEIIGVQPPPGGDSSSSEAGPTP